MFLEVPDLLSADELKRVRDIAATAPFVDGRVSNPHNQTKKNLQIDTSSPLHKEASQIVGTALLRSEPVKNFTFMKRLLPPLLCRYQPDMTYGAHCDVSYLQSPQAPPLRSDISCTVFLADPATYDGGELIVNIGDKAVRSKCPAGGAVIYPSTTIHEVAPVTRGERLVAITFIESQIADEKQRYLLYTLNEIAALEGYSIAWESRVRLDYVRFNLHRLWAS